VPVTVIPIDESLEEPLKMGIYGDLHGFPNLADLRLPGPVAEDENPSLITGIFAFPLIL
jgi:hypothetical protein